MSTITTSFDQSKAEAFVGSMVGVMNGAAIALMTSVGHRTGLFDTMAGLAPSTSAEIARATGLNERYVREWLSAQAASGFVTFDAGAKKFALSPEQAAVFADEESTVCMTGGFHSLAAVFADESKLTQAFKTGKGVGWGEHCSCLFCGVERFSQPV